MVHTSAITAAAAALLLALPAHGAGLYNKQSPVVQVDAKNYDRLIAKSNHTSIVEFYAPWCGHCKSLHPQWEKAARGLAGLAKVAAVNCDEDANKQFCGSMGVQGFPTLKIVKPGKKFGKPTVEDYNGPREAKDIIDAVVSRMPNHVKKVTDKDLDAFLKEGNDTAKAILFTEKGTTSALLKAVAVDFLGSIKVAQIRNKEKECVERFGVTKFPTVILLPGGEDAQGIVYDGEVKKPALVKFLSQIAEPNPDPAPAKVKMPKKKDTKKSDEKADKKAKEDFESASSSHAKSEATEAPPTAADETIIEETRPAGESPDPIATPTAAPIDLEKITPPIPSLAGVELFKKCFEPKSGTCVLAFIPDAATDATTPALLSLAEVAQKYTTNKRAIFPFYAISVADEDVKALKSSLGLDRDVELVAVNNKRGWWRSFEGSDHSLQSIENWIDAVRMGEGNKHKLPVTLLPEKKLGEEQKPLGEIPLEAAETVAAKEAEPETETVTQNETVTRQIREVPTDAEAETTEEVPTPEAQATPEPESTVAAKETDAATEEPAQPTDGHDEL